MVRVGSWIMTFVNHKNINVRLCVSAFFKSPSHTEGLFKFVIWNEWLGTPAIITTVMTAVSQKWIYLLQHPEHLTSAQQWYWDAVWYRLLHQKSDPASWPAQQRIRHSGGAHQKPQSDGRARKRGNSGLVINNREWMIVSHFMLTILDGFFMCLSWTHAACAGNTGWKLIKLPASLPPAGLKWTVINHTQVITLNLFMESDSDNKVNEHLCSQKKMSYFLLMWPKSLILLSFCFITYTSSAAQHGAARLMNHVHFNPMATI